MPHTIEPLYRSLIARLDDAGLKSEIMSERLANLIVASRGYLLTLSRRPLVSDVANKKYFMFVNDSESKFSRPVNEELYDDNLTRDKILKVMNCEVHDMDELQITKTIYSCAISYCCCADILKTSDQKTPGTFFEFLIGHLVSRALGVNPKKTISVPTLGIDINIPTDFVFDLGPEKTWVHLPVKTSTRERVVQVWAHQRVLDGMHGVGRFKGVLVALAETNKQKNTSVVEVCLPNQWSVYQMYIAQMFRVYYLDIPTKYVELKERYPFIQVKPFGAFFREIDQIQTAGAGG